MQTYSLRIVCMVLMWNAQIWGHRWTDCFISFYSNKLLPIAAPIAIIYLNLHTNLTAFTSIPCRISTLQTIPFLSSSFLPKIPPLPIHFNHCGWFSTWKRCECRCHRSWQCIHTIFNMREVKQNMISRVSHRKTHVSALASLLGVELGVVSAFLLALE